MTHRQALPTTAPKISQTAVQLSSVTVSTGYRRACQHGSYTVEQHAFVYESYVKCVSARKCWKHFRHKFPGNIVQSTRSINKLINKVRSTR
jgi:hypothetical protein